jgi:hypothetical protein
MSGFLVLLRTMPSWYAQRDFCAARSCMHFIYCSVRLISPFCLCEFQAELGRLDLPHVFLHGGGVPQRVPGQRQCAG